MPGVIDAINRAFANTSAEVRAETERRLRQLRRRETFVDAASIRAICGS
jgi:hypothetical protein